MRLMFTVYRDDVPILECSLWWHGRADQWTTAERFPKAATQHQQHRRRHGGGEGRGHQPGAGGQGQGAWRRGLESADVKHHLRICSSAAAMLRAVRSRNLELCSSLFRAQSRAQCPQLSHFFMFSHGSNLEIYFV